MGYPEADSSQCLIAIGIFVVHILEFNEMMTHAVFIFLKDRMTIPWSYTYMLKIFEKSKSLIAANTPMQLA